MGLIVVWATTATRARFSHTGIFSPPLASLRRLDMTASHRRLRTRNARSQSNAQYVRHRALQCVQCDSLHALSGVYTRDAPRRTTHVRIRYKFHEALGTSGQRLGIFAGNGSADAGTAFRGRLASATRFWGQMLVDPLVLGRRNRAGKYVISERRHAWREYTAAQSAIVNWVCVCVRVWLAQIVKTFPNRRRRNWQRP